MPIQLRISLLIVFITSLFPFCTTRAREVMIDDDFVSQNLLPIAQVLASPQRQLPPEVVLQNFQKDTTSYQKPYLKDNRWVYYWVYVFLQNCGTTTQELTVEIDNPNIDTLYYWQYDEYSNRTYTSAIMGDCLPFDKRSIPHRNFLHQFSLPPDSSTQLLFFVAKYGQPINCGFTLAKTTYFYEQDSIETSVYMFVSGMLLLAVLLIFFVIHLLPTGSIFLGVSMLFLLFITWWQEGYGFQYLWQHTPLFNNMMRPLGLSLVLLCWWQYSYRFFNVHKNLPHFKVPFYFFLGLLLSYLLAFIAIYYFNWIHCYKELKVFFYVYYFGVLCFIVFLMFFLYCYTQQYKNHDNYWVKEATQLFRFIQTAFLLLFCYVGFFIFPHIKLLSDEILHYAGLIMVSIFIGFFCFYVFQMAYGSYIENLRLREKISWSLIEGQEQERRRIGHDLHDSIVNSLLALRNTLSLIEFANPSDKHNCVAQTQSITEEIRRISHQLMPAIFEKENRIENILGHLCSTWQPILYPLQLTMISNLGNINTTQLPPSYHLFLYRILQELISNVVKHAQATKVHIHLYKESNNLCLLVVDNGIGFDTSGQVGLGFQNIKRRVTYLGGYTKFMSDSKGTTVEIGVPLKPNWA